MLWKNNNILSLIVVALTTMATGMNAQSTSDYSDGVFFVNEDWYGHQNSTVNFLTNDGEWIYRVFQKTNSVVPTSTDRFTVTGFILLQNRKKTLEPLLQEVDLRWLMPNL